MGKRERIRKEIAKMVLPPTPADYLTNAQLKTADKILNYLHSQGVVIKVDSEWPYLLKKYYPDTLNRLIEEHFTQVDPLIEEVKDGNTN